jgi:polyisoprenoid-binding protein YceI
VLASRGHPDANYMEVRMRSAFAVAVFAIAASGAAFAAPVDYTVDTKHTFPSFEADHFGGMSVWRGKFTSSSGKIVLDREARTGTVEINIDPSSISTGNPDLDKHVKSGDFLDVEKFPQATYKGKLTKFKDGAPTEVDGQLTLHGVTKPVILAIHSFKCMPHPMNPQLEFCGADASTSINREDFGVGWGKNFGFAMWVKLAIQVEANRPK